MSTGDCNRGRQPGGVNTKKKKPINRKESSHKDRNTDVKFMPRVQGPKFIVSIGYIDYEAALALIFIFVIKVKEK